MLYFVAGLALLGAFLFMARAFVIANPTTLARSLRRWGAVAMLAVAGLLALAGRVAIAAPLAGFAFMLLAREAAGGRATPRRGGTSEVKTDWLAMVLDHDSGTLDGQILQGTFAGRRVSDLDEGGLRDLLRETSVDPASAQIIEAYLDRAHPEWRGGDGGGNQRDGGEAGDGGSSGGAMTDTEARDILGVPMGADEEEIRTAHRKLMKAVHPDHGGSTYLASQINRAKDLLLAKQRH